MRLIKYLWMFYQRLIIPSLALSVLISIFGMGYINICVGIGISYIVLAPFFHYFTYEVRNPDEYYFYYNLGLSRSFLWLSTVAISLIVGVILISL